jgi:phosphinothricin acetyltransferase
MPTTDLAVAIRPMTKADADAVLAIYQSGIETGHATFETAAPDWAAFDRSRLPEHRFVAADPATGQVIGWAALSMVSERCVYAGVAENSVYVHDVARGRGVGLALMRALIESSERGGIWTIQTGVFPENVASVALHERVGFRIVGRRERLGQHHGVWRDVLFLERRSPIVG